MGANGYAPVPPGRRLVRRCGKSPIAMQMREVTPIAIFIGAGGSFGRMPSLVSTNPPEEAEIEEPEDVEDSYDGRDQEQG